MIRFTLNGRPVEVDVEIDTPLLWVIRDDLGLTGTKFGCGIGLCGACTVHVEGRSIRSCITSVGAIAGKHVITIEGLEPQGKHPVQQAWAELQVPQCGYCQSGQIMQAVTLLADFPDPTDADIDAVMSGNLCRCMTYVRIRAAIHDAIETRARPSAVSQPRVRSGGSEASVTNGVCSEACNESKTCPSDHTKLSAALSRTA